MGSYAVRFGLHYLIGLLVVHYLAVAGIFAFLFSAIADVFAFSQDWYLAFVWGIFLAYTIPSVGIAVQRLVRDHYKPFSRREKLRFALLAGVGWVVAMLLFITIVAALTGGNPFAPTYYWVTERGYAPLGASLVTAFAFGLLFLSFYLVMSALTYFVAGMFSRLFSKVALAFVRRFGHGAFQRTTRLRRAAGLIAVIAMLPLATAALSERLDPSPQATAELTDDGTLIIEWRGEVVPGMAEQLRQTFLKYADQSQRVELYLHSGGGDFEEGERVIGLLQQIKTTHELATVVANGNWCASMCVAIYLQGEERYAAAASIWVAMRPPRLSGTGDSA